MFAEKSLCPKTEMSFRCTFAFLIAVAICEGELISMNMKKLLFSLLFICLFAQLFGQGMWLPVLLEKQNEKEMKSLGLKLSADDIYSPANASIKDAICQFDGGCTGEII